MSTQRDNARDSLAHLDQSERRIFAELVRLLVRSDGELSDSERDHINRLAGEAGREEFWKFMDEAANSEKTADDILAGAEGVGEEDAHELIYGALYELSISDGIDAGENDILERLAATWKLNIHDVPES